MDVGEAFEPSLYILTGCQEYCQVFERNTPKIRIITLTTNTVSLLLGSFPRNQVRTFFAQLIIKNFKTYKYAPPLGLREGVLCCILQVKSCIHLLPLKLLESLIPGFFISMTCLCKGNMPPNLNSPMLCECFKMTVAIYYLAHAPKCACHFVCNPCFQEHTVQIAQSV